MKKTYVVVPNMETLLRGSLRARLGKDVFQPSANELNFYREHLKNRQNKKENQLIVNEKRG